MSSSDSPDTSKDHTILPDLKTGKTEPTKMKESSSDSSDTSDEESIVPYMKIGKTKPTKQESSSDSSDTSGEDILPDMKIGKTKPIKMKQTSSETHTAIEDDVDGKGSDSDSDSDLSDSDYVCTICNKKFSGYIPLKQHEKGKNHLKTLLKKKREKKLLDKITAAEKMTESDEEQMVFKKPYAICKPCGKEFGGQETYYMHVISKAHKKKIQQASVLDQVCDEGEINAEKLKELYKNKKSTEDQLGDIQNRITSLLTKDEEDAIDVEEFECKECDKSFSGLIPYAQHLTSKVHAKKVEKKKLLHNLTPEDSDDIQRSANPRHRDIITLVVEDGILVCKLCSTSFSGPESAMMHMKSRGHSKNFEKRKRKQDKKQAAAVAAAVLSEDSDNDDESVKSAEIKRIEVKKESRRRLNSSNNADETSMASVSASERRDDQVKNKVGDTFHERNSRQRFDSSSKVTSEETLVSEKDGKGENKVKDTEKKVYENESSYEKYKKYKEIVNALKKEDSDN